jgi:hypothetical protein
MWSLRRRACQWTRRSGTVMPIRAKCTSYHHSFLNDLFMMRIKKFVCAVSGKNGEMEVQFSSYPRPWEAARTTSAASSFFDPITIGPNGQTFLDGATGSNNPVRILWQEAKILWHTPKNPLNNQIQCLVSIGTGAPAGGSFSKDVFAIGRTLVRMATETEVTANDFPREHEELDA